MILQERDQLFIFASEEVRVSIAGRGSLSQKTTEIFNNVIPANTVKMVYNAYATTYIDRILLYEIDSDTVVKAFVNGTEDVHQKYEDTIESDAAEIYRTSGWVGNKFIPGQEPVTPPAAVETDFTKSISLTSPTASEDVTLFFTKEEITIVQIADVIRGPGASADWNIVFGSNRGVVDAKVFLVERNTVSTTGASTTSFDNPVIPANSWVWFITSAVSGTIDDLSITINYT